MDTPTLKSRLHTPGPWILGFVLVLSIIYLQSLMAPLFPNTHEHETYPLRTMLLCNAIGEGQWDGRWSSELAGGYGYPFFNYYAPGFYYACALVHTVGLDFATSTKVTVCLFTLLGIAGMFFLGRILWQSSFAGGIAAVIWTFIPYRIVNLYVRGDLAELSAMSLSPWAVLGHLAIVRGGGWGSVVLAAAANGAVIWTHNISALLLQPFLVVFDLFLLWTEKTRPRLAWRKLLMAHLLALALGAAFWAPALFEKKYVHIDRVKLEGSMFDLERHFVYPLQLLLTHWGWGISVKGPIDGMPFQIGMVALAVGLIGFIAAMRSRSEQVRHRALALVLLSSGATLMTLYISAPLWKHLPLAGYIQFPWRLFALVAIALPLLGGAAAAMLEQRRRWLAVVFFIAMAFVAPYSMSGNMRPYTRMELSDDVILAKLQDGFVTTTQMNEYLPRTVPFEKNPVATRAQEIDAPSSASIEKTTLPGEFPPAFRVQLTQETTLTWRHYYFPGWHVIADDCRIAAEPSPEGFIRFKLPPGPHEVQFTFSNTPIRLLAKLTSLIALLAIMIGSLRRGKLKSARISTEG